jgi:hypothetical protein
MIAAAGGNDTILRICPISGQLPGCEILPMGAWSFATGANPGRNAPAANLARGVLKGVGIPEKEVAALVSARLWYHTSEGANR